MTDGETAGDDLRLTGLTRRFGPVTAVDDVTLTVPAGSFFALLGASGCGKTTTLRMVAGLDRPDAGRVLLGDRDLTRLPPHRRPVNTVFQSYALFPHLDVFENVAFGLRRCGVPDVAGRVRRMLALVRLAGYDRRRPGQLSGGEQQRVALARALVNQPRVLLLDEPLGALDLRLRRQMQTELKRVQDEVGVTFLHVTHDQEEAMTLADTVAVLNAGRVEQLGPPADLYELPATAFVATFLGRCNLLPAEAAGPTGGEVPVRAYGSRFRVPAARARSDRGAVHLGVRPEKLHLTGTVEQVPSGHHSVAGTVTDVSYLGVGTEYLLRTGWGTELSAFAPNSGVTADRWPIGATVQAYWWPDHAFLLPRSTGPASVEPASLDPDEVPA
ncbi:ABC transporter ATP-binding protein [Micromonospora zhanjiangensis]|uniref:ABC transporter ATP-binding protein n=1 Tax=Micromonospora zhanjiangensis TaxID=1522057 RepID=A0ABV8KN16_9ACTN